ncbi:amidohydrolase [Acinetobacter qingfengensis]|uniref:Hydrolase n=1 Tax=Acinetobacter qingfengensis TaxID=1262585 RepID=A0A1E7R440_9GAMM|nr:amidohydrolase [Acinetobacter qingfengensis]KAA8733740.1 amidohydrolase [Acinetobacter qingfengensis]OEY94037.1 hydrolase [Acinetobacter qingfengensis]
MGATGLLEAQLRNWRRELHRYPELSGQEVQTTSRLKTWLAEYNIESSSWGLTTGLVADIGAGQPIIALRADIDALPIHEQIDQAFTSSQNGVMHACGHDLHTSTILGAAILLKSRESELKGTVRIIFQPAEETYRGAYEVLNAGILDDVSAIFGFHNVPELPLGTFATRAGAFYANVDRFKITINGKGGHAGRPHETRDPVIVASQLIQAVQTISSRSINNLETCVVSITQIHGGTTWNVIPETVELEGTVRTHAPEIRIAVEQQLRQIVQGIALSHSVEILVDWENGPAALINTPQWATFSKKVAADQGYRIEDVPLYLIGEDFGAYLEKIPGAFVSIGSGSPFGLHHPKYQPNESLIFPAAQYFATLAIQALESIA